MAEVGNQTVIEGAERLAQGLMRFAIRTPTLPPATHTNAYALGERAALWVDPASEFDDEVQRSLAAMSQMEQHGLRFEAYFLTHHHADHAGGLLAMSRRKPLPVWAHPATHARVQADPRCVRVDVGEGPLPTPLADWTAIHTPGHAPGHLCLHRPRDGQLIAGDMVAGVGTILVDPDDGDMGAYLQSLARLAAVDVQRVYPAHGDPISPERRIFDTYIEHRLTRERKVLQALRSDAQPLVKLLPRCYADTPQTLWPLAQRSLLAHLHKLNKEGRAQRNAIGWYNVETD